MGAKENNEKAVREINATCQRNKVKLQAMVSLDPVGVVSKTLFTVLGRLLKINKKTWVEIVDA